MGITSFEWFPVNVIHEEEVLQVSTTRYDPRPLSEMLKRLLRERGESYRGASIRAGLDYGALFRFVETCC